MGRACLPKALSRYAGPKESQLTKAGQEYVKPLFHTLNITAIVLLMNSANMNFQEIRLNYQPEEPSDREVEAF